MKYKIIILIPFFLSLITACANKQIYMFSYFNNNGDDGLHLAYSEDGYNWHALNDNKSFLKPDLSDDKLMRDPCIIKGGDGKYHMVWTVSWTENGIGYASTKDLINWSTQKLIPVMSHQKNARNCWAPEITYDKKNNLYMIYWATTIKGLYTDSTQFSEDDFNHRIFYITTKDFITFSDTKLLYEKGFNVIDATIIPTEEKFIMFLKDETLIPPQKNIRIAYATNLTGPYTKPSEPITGDYWAEGPTVLKKGRDWIVYFDKYKDGKYGAVKSNDLVNWIDISDKISLPRGTRHGSIFIAPASILKAIK